MFAAEFGRLGAGFRLFEDADDLLLGEPRFLHDGDSDRAVSPGILSPLSGHFHGATSTLQTDRRNYPVKRDMSDSKDADTNESIRAMRTRLIDN